MPTPLRDWALGRLPTTPRGRVSRMLTPRERCLLDQLAARIGRTLGDLRLEMAAGAPLLTPAVRLKLSVFGAPLVICLPAECALEICGRDSDCQAGEVPLVLGTFDRSRQLAFSIAVLKLLRTLRSEFPQRVFFVGIDLAIFPEDACKELEDFKAIGFYLHRFESAYACRLLISPLLLERLGAAARRLRAGAERSRVLQQAVVSSRFSCTLESSSLWTFSALSVGSRIPVAVSKLHNALLEAGAFSLPLALSRLEPGTVGGSVLERKVRK